MKTMKMNSVARAGMIGTRSGTRFADTVTEAGFFHELGTEFDKSGSSRGARAPLPKRNLRQQRPIARGVPAAFFIGELAAESARNLALNDTPQTPSCRRATQTIAT